jgi:isoquinoline 1-oxidoreductase beta subunit
MLTNTVTRRDFIKIGGLSSIGLTLGFYTPAGAKENSIELLTKESAETLGVELNAWVSIDTKGKVTLMNHRSEMGQGSYQTVPQIIAEELEVNLDQVQILFAPGNGAKYGSQLTGGSSTVRGAYKHLMKVGASAREMLIEAAANKWAVSKTDCYAENGFVIHRASGKKFGYGELVQEASKLQPPKDVKLKEAKNYKVIRQSLPRQDTPLKTNGTAIFGLDKKLPGMLYSVVERNPRFAGKIKSFDDTETKKVPGVRHVIPVKMSVFASLREGVAVVADTLWAATQGRKALKIEWDDAGFEHLNTEQLFTRMRDDLKKPGLSQRTGGNADAVFAKAEKKVEAVYETPYESHSCMEPLNCIAHFKGDSCDIWGPIQAPDWIQSLLTGLIGLPPEKINVNMTFLGGGFGRKAFMDYPHEAAVISKEINAPVQVVWTREDDMTQGPFRPGAVYECKAGLSAQGNIQSFQAKIAAQNMDHQWPGADKSTFNGSTVEGLPEGYFESISHYSFSDIPTESPIPVMWWRSVYSSTNGFAYESFIDELSREAGQDPLDFRRKYLGSERYQALIDTLEQKSNWKARGKNEGWGVAITECFKTTVGEIVKVSRNADGKIKIDKVIAVMDCGWHVNPDIVKGQVEGSIIMALGAAIKHETHFTDGKAVERNFDSYKMPRINEIPEIEVYIMDNEEKPGGVGEPGLPPFSPALTNAIFDLTGKRIRKLPFNLNEV